MIKVLFFRNLDTAKTMLDAVGLYLVKDLMQITIDESGSLILILRI
jgi:hypothetical protein